MSVLVTGVAGFIGSFTARALLDRGEQVIGVDNLNSYYNPALKHARLHRLAPCPAFHFVEADIADPTGFSTAMAKHRPERIIHLAAQAGVRYSLEQPFSYGAANLSGQLTLLEYARHLNVSHLVYASSSSVYGRNKDVPFREDHRTDLPASLYGATKKSGELLAESYAHLYRIPLTGLRFFTVYGPWGRPDMAYWIFTEKMLRGEPIDIFNHGRMARDFTYIDDIVAGVLAALDRPPSIDDTPHRVFNLGNDQPQPLLHLVELLETYLGRTAEKHMTDMKIGDVEKTWADISRAREVLEYQPKISLDEGIKRYIDWRMDLPSSF